MADDDELTPEQKFAAEDPETLVPRELCRGRSREEIVAQLVRLDWPRARAEAFVERIADDLKHFRESPEARRQLKAEARREVFGGTVMVLLGIAGTTATLLAALGGVLLFVLVFIGLILGGFAYLGRGLKRLGVYRQLALPFESEGCSSEDSSASNP